MVAMATMTATRAQSKWVRRRCRRAWPFIEQLLAPRAHARACTPRPRQPSASGGCAPPAPPAARVLAWRRTACGAAGRFARRSRVALARLDVDAGVVLVAEGAD